MNKKVPMRRCVGCMQSFPKTEIVRFVRAGGSPVIDRTGKMDGRGVYLCRSLDCFDLANKKKRLAHALGISLTLEETANLREKYAKELSYAEVTE